MEAIKKKETQVVEYNITDAAIAEMKDKYKNLQITDTKSYETIRVAIGHVREKRVAVEKKRTELKADAIKWGKVVDGEAKRITSLLLEIEEPLKAEKQRVDDEKQKEKEEKERLEWERVQGIKERIEEIRIQILDTVEKDSVDLARMITQLENMPIPEQIFEEFTFEAKKVKEETIEALRGAVKKQVKWEEEAVARKAEGERLEGIRQEQEERQRRMDLEEKERKQKLREEQERLEAGQRELEKEKAKIEKERQAEKEAKEKAERDALEAKEREEKVAAEKARKKALRPDKEKLIDYLNKILKIPKPEIQAEKLRNTVNVLLYELQELKKKLEKTL